MNHQRARGLVDQYADMVLRLCTTYVGSRAEAEDLTQDTLLALFAHTKPFSSPEHEKAWVLRTAINRCKDHLKSGHHRFRAHTEVPDTAQPATDPSPGPVTDAVRQLPDDQRIAIHLFYFEGYSAGEIAKLTNSSTDAIYQRLSRARTTLATLLEGKIHA